MVHDRILQRCRNNIRSRHYVMTIHAEEEMNDDLFTIFDVEHAVLNGNITERRKDHLTGEWKYLINGSSLDERSLFTAVKLSPTGKLVFLTIYKGD